MEELFSVVNLKQAIREGIENYNRVLPQIIEHTAEGLEYYHRKGWIHCDVKPDNFLIDESYTVKLIDFSIAQREAKGLAKLFGKRKVCGTRSYMSPEQIRAKPLDSRSDIYSYGCMLFELVAGKMPFTATSPDELLNKHLRAPIPGLQAANTQVTPEFAELVHRLMAKDRDDRPRTLYDFLEEFRKIRMFKVRSIKAKE